MLNSKPHRSILNLIMHIKLFEVFHYDFYNFHKSFLILIFAKILHLFLLINFVRPLFALSDHTNRAKLQGEGIKSLAPS